MNDNLYTAYLDGRDGLYLIVEEENNKAFLESIEQIEHFKTDLKGFFNRELEAVGKLKGMTVFYIGCTEDLFGKKYYYEPVGILSENRIYCRHVQYHGRDYNYINGAWT